MLTCIHAGAQTIEDALNFSKNDYYGTARSMALGNAMTAIGSDLGSIAINPAGAAVATYSQVAITPGLSISSNKANFHDAQSAEATKTGKTIFTLPNVAGNFVFGTGRLTGVRCFSIGFVANMSNNFNNSWNHYGDVATSYAGNIANFARYDGLTALDMEKYGDADWIATMAYKAGAITRPAGTADDYWAGITEDYSLVHEGGTVYDVLTSNPVNLQYSHLTRGNKMDYILNMAMNISDLIFLGANIGIQSYSYSMEDYLHERAINGVAYSQRFASLRHSYSYSSSASGIYAKFGILATPVAGLRLGAAFTTPTAMSIKERWFNDMDVAVKKDDSGDGIINTASSTPESSESYRVKSPLRFNVGAAYTFAHFAMVSLDYEYVNYSQVTFMDNNHSAITYFRDLNDTIKGTYDVGDTDRNYDFLGVAHCLRAGIEIKPVDIIAIRAGYILETSGRRFYDNNRAFSDKAKTHVYSFGLGYDSPRSIFCDITCRIKNNPKNATMLYSDYHDEYFSPRVIDKQILTTVVATVGWRF